MAQATRISRQTQRKHISISAFAYQRDNVGAAGNGEGMKSNIGGVITPRTHMMI